MRLSRPTTCLSDLALDSRASGELDAAACARVDAHLAACAGCRARRDLLEHERASFLAAAPSFELHARRFVPRLRRARGRMFAGVVLGAAALAAAALLALQPGVPAERLKGQESLRCFVKRGDHVEAAGPSTVLRAGDRLRFAYSATQERYFALFGRDASSAMVYYPAARQAVRLAAGKQQALDFSLELDAAPGPEIIVALFCAQAFELEPLRAALASIGRIDPARGCRVEVLSFPKEIAR